MEGCSSVAYGGHLHLVCALRNVTIRRDIHFPNQHFGEVCSYNRHILLQALPLFYVSSWKLGIEGSRSFLCLFIIFTAQKCPFYQSSISLKCPFSWWHHEHSFRPLAPVPQGPLSSPGTFCLSLGVSIFSSHIMDRRCHCEMTVGKSFYFIVTNFSFVIISRKGDLVHLFCEKLMLLIVNDVMARSCAFSRLSDFF